MSRILVLMLVAANLLYFGWAHWVDTGNARLTAVAASPRKTPATPVAPKPAGPPPCATLGPFADELTALQAQQKLEAAGWGLLRRDVTEALPDGWWVFVANSDASQQARTLNAIRRAGINDAFAMPDDPEHRVSVGIFGAEDRAEDRAARIQRLQLDAQVTERKREQLMIWFDVPGVARETLSDGRLVTTGIALDALRVETCPVAAQVAPAEPATAIIPAP